MDREEDFSWLIEHGAYLVEQFAGKWVAIRNGEVIGSGATATEAAEQALQRAPDGDFLLEAIESEADVIYALL